MGKYGILRVVSGNDQGKQIELNRTVTSVGRGADQMLVVADIAVSRRHIQIHLLPNGYKMQDLGSPNGSMVNGKRVAEGMLVDGDQIEIGNSLLRFEHPPSRPQQEAPPAPPPQPTYAPPPAYVAPQPAYAPPAPVQQMGYAPPAPAYQQPQQQAYMPPQPMPQLAAPQAAFPSMVQPMPQMVPAPAPMQSQAHSQSMISGSSIAVAPVGTLGFLANKQKRTMYLGALGGALFVGLMGLTVTSMRSGNSAKVIEKALDHYNTGTKDFTAARYDIARKAFESALALAPDSAELKKYVEACDSEEKVRKLLEQAKKQLDDRKYTEALKLFDKVDKSSTQYEDAQSQARQTRREAVKSIHSDASAMAKTDVSGAMEKINQGLEYEPDNADLLELKSRLSNSPPPKPAEDTTQVAENTPPTKPEKVEKPEKVKPEVVKKTTPTPPPPAAGGDLGSNKGALASYKNRDFAGAISAMKSVGSSKAAATVKDLEDVKSQNDKASKLEGSNPKGALDAYQAAASADKRLGGGLSSYFSGKISAMQAKAGGTGAKPAAPAGGGDPAKDAQADSMLGQARGLASKNPAQARLLCRKVMQLYGSNNQKNPKVQEAYKLLTSIKGGASDDDDF